METTRGPESAAGRAPATEGTTGAGRVVLRDVRAGGWLTFGAPRDVLVARGPGEVTPLLREIQRAVSHDSLHAAGFVSYEAAPAFDAHLAARSRGDFPYAWFGLYDEPSVSRDLPGGGAWAGDENWQPSITAAEYGVGFAALRDYIRAGDTYQVNYTYRLRATLAADPWSAFLGLAGNGETPYAAYLDLGDWAILSASPEMFFRLDGDVIESRPMKGTAPRGLWAADDRRKAEELHASPKERAENVMIVDMVRNDLGRVSRTGTVHVPELFSVERYPTVWQMTSTVRARTDEPLDRIFAGLFPPASIVGVPKRRAMEIIAELESTPRRLYTGAIGYAAPGRRAQFSVAIRTLLVERATGRAEYGVGGGIVWDSDCDGELAESRVKARALHGRRPEFELLETLRWNPGQGYALIQYHLDRLLQSAEYFGFDVRVRQVEDALDRAATPLPAVPHRLRLLADRLGRVRCEASRMTPADETFADVAVAEAPVDRNDVFLYHKTTCRAQYVEALAARQDWPDVLLYNGDGEITESTIANVALEIDGALYTPPVSCGLLAGTYRAWMLGERRLRERVLRLDDVASATAVYLMNAVRGMHRIRVSFDVRRHAALSGLEPARRPPSPAAAR